jgi:alpha,alpha-trehalase
MANSQHCPFVFSTNPLHVNWTPYTSSPPPVPLVLRDPYILYAIASEDFRQFLDSQNQIDSHPSLSDYKSLVDSLPRYEIESGPWKPQNLLGQEIPPQDLSFTQLIEYIHTNYDLSRPPRALPSSEIFEPVPQHPLINQIVKLQPTSPGLNLITEALQAIHIQWQSLTQSSPQQATDNSTSLISLPKPYVVAGGRFQESYYWDSYWIIRGLLKSGYKKISVGMLENFVSMQEQYGIIANGNRYYYLTRTQVPMFMEIIIHLKQQKLLDFSLIHPLLPDDFPQGLESRALKAASEYYKNIWKGTDRYNSELGLFRYSDGAGGELNPNVPVIRPEAALQESRYHETHAKRVFAESGWDMSYTRFGNSPQSWIPVDLNAILYAYTQQLSQLFELIGDLAEADYFRRESQRIKQNIWLHLYDKESTQFFDYPLGNIAGAKVLTAASFFPYIYNIYPHDHLHRQGLHKLFRQLKPKDHFGIHTTNQAGPGQWDGDWTWANLNQTALKALVTYGLHKEATELSVDYCYMVLKNFQDSGLFFEKYRASNGSTTIPDNSEIYGNEVGFGWTNAVLVEFIEYLTQNQNLHLLIDRLEQESGN